jgi:hypothetical protein
MGNELALDVNVLWLLILSLFFVFIVTAAAWRVIAVIACAGVLIFGLAKARAEVRAVEALEAEACPRRQPRLDHPHTTECNHRPWHDD